MAIVKAPSGRGGRVEVPLPALLSSLERLVPGLEAREIDRDLVRARLADGLRDAGLSPPHPDQVAGWFAPLDEGASRRLALLVEASRQAPVAQALGSLAPPSGPGAMVEKAFFALSAQTPLLTLSLLRQSPIRLEELARRWLAALGASVLSEDDDSSRKQLERLDYERLLGEAEQARASAEERAAYLRKLQEAQDQKRRPRGKW